MKFNLKNILYLLALACLLGFIILNGVFMFVSEDHNSKSGYAGIILGAASIFLFFTESRFSEKTTEKNLETIKTELDSINNQLRQIKQKIK